jgi:putative FmdB family regulatory protein
MPIYEFRCLACGARFEELMSADAGAAACPECASETTERVLSAQAPPMSLVRSPGDARKQERRNARLHDRAKADFKQRRRRKPAAGSDGAGT